LVIIPRTLLFQWEQEIQTRVKKDTLKYLVFRKDGETKKNEKKIKTYRVLMPINLVQYDLVLTSYDQIEEHSPLLQVHWLRVILDEAVSNCSLFH